MLELLRSKLLPSAKCASSACSDEVSAQTQRAIMNQSINQLQHYCLSSPSSCSTFNIHAAVNESSHCVAIGPGMMDLVAEGCKLASNSLGPSDCGFLLSLLLSEATLHFSTQLDSINPIQSIILIIASTWRLQSLQRGRCDGVSSMDVRQTSGNPTRMAAFLPVTAKFQGQLGGGSCLASHQSLQT